MDTEKPERHSGGGQVSTTRRLGAEPLRVLRIQAKGSGAVGREIRSFGRAGLSYKLNVSSLREALIAVSYLVRKMRENNPVEAHLPYVILMGSLIYYSCPWYPSIPYRFVMTGPPRTSLGG